ncbi:YadA-like family protein [Xenorhabdus khoisanae]|uniref:YadA C-terminal domain-containing protein n=1 Tax=Xenorhabdus khoisanae TaxID=880157 RepID=UPI002358A42E|nr:YadA-like family protein [Xenorhabdus khoisanae]MDC9614644.1 YadA-like family protein [Xenorhabdus khoisanae]
MKKILFKPAILVVSIGILSASYPYISYGSTASLVEERDITKENLKKLTEEKLEYLTRMTKVSEDIASAVEKNGNKSAETIRIVRAKANTYAKALEEAVKDKARVSIKATSADKDKVGASVKTASADKDKAGASVKATSAAEDKVEASVDAVNSSEINAKASEKNYADISESIVARAEEISTEMHKRFAEATKQANKEVAKEITEQLDKEIDEKAKNLYKYTQQVELKADIYHYHSEKRFDKLELEMRQNINRLDDKINRVGKRANAGIASVSAMTNIPYSYNQKVSVGIGLGQYRDGNAIAVGTQAKLTENVNIRASTSWNNSDGAVFGAGVAIGW